jgi:adenylate kinase|uniref:Adenylate kinase n=1 Tax=candidate division WOR-3 bacterium TaxID=2052148 RepID=A0A7C3YT96_UNCW3
MIIILLGPPGSGKGTHAELLARRWNLSHIATGDIFRSEITRETPLGLRVKEFLEKGLLVPDELVLLVIEQSLRKGKNRGCVFDGFPRTLNQAFELDRILAQWHLAVSFVFLLEISEAEILRRLTTRRVCRQCQAIYNLESKPPKVSGKCDICGGELYQREDDMEETIKKRIRVYQEETKELIPFYEKKGLLYRVSGEKEEIQEAINKIIESQR